MAHADAQTQQANEFCREILPAVSRTFALGIRVLPGELGAAVRDAYLLCRIGERQYHALRAKCRAFAEALQTVNILKDVARDAEHENSIYIPEQLLRAHGSAHATILADDRAHENRAAIGALIQLAWQDLDEA